MKKIVIIIFGILIYSNILLSEEVSVVTAEEVAKNFLHLRLQIKFDTLFLVKTETRNNQALCYFFNFPDDQGYIVVAAEDHVHPILAYNRSHSFYPDDEFPPQYISWMNNYYDQIEYVKQNNLPPDSAIESEWQACQDNSLPLGDMILTGVLPLLSTTWKQGCYYNELCPEDFTLYCGHCLVGCVATAMAQIMKYHNWPDQGTGVYSYNHPDYGILSADFGATTYNWSGMPNSISSSNLDVATISYHCGISVGMDYGPSSSGASMSANAFKNYFKYESVCDHKYKTPYSQTDWENMLKADLDNGRPVQYSGYGSYGGHAFVCDGYDGTNFFHFNFGWGGYGDGYFYLSNINPNGIDLNNMQAAIFNITPDICYSAIPIGWGGSGSTQTFTGGGTGIWFNSSNNPCGNPSPGNEQIYSFVAPFTGTYSIWVTAASGYVDYMWKTTSCSSSDWNCIDRVSTTGQIGAMSWTAGTTYYILLDDEDNVAGTHTFYIDLVCQDCPIYNYIISPTSSWNTHYSTHSHDGCKIYRINVTSGVKYTFSTGCGYGAASYDTYLELYNSTCSLIDEDNDGCLPNSSIIEWTANYSGYAYLKVRSNSPSSSGYVYLLGFRGCTVPAQPGTISGNDLVCQGSTNSYSISPVSGATSYTWLLPSGWSGSSTSNIITVTAGNSGGTISVTANNSCGSSIVQSKSITVKTSPVQPGAISGITPVCEGGTYTYSILPVPEATAYTWTLPMGDWSGNSSSTSITTIAGSSGGNIEVTANNSCGSSIEQTKYVDVIFLLEQPGVISGKSPVCAGITQKYSISPVPWATSYTWLLPSGWSGSSTSNIIAATVGSSGGTISVTANNFCFTSSASSKSITVIDIPAQPGTISGINPACEGTTNIYSISPVPDATSYSWSFPPCNWSGSSTTTSITANVGSCPGFIAVTAHNSCGSSAFQTKDVDLIYLLGQTGPISGNSQVCLGSTNTYSISPVSGATSYTWLLPSGWSGSSTSNIITATAGSSGGTISVTAYNTCFSNSAVTKSVSVSAIPDQPGALTGLTTVEEGSGNPYSVASVSGATSYTWILPSGWSGSSTSNIIITTAGSSGGLISVTADNICGSSSPSIINVNVIPYQLELTEVIIGNGQIWCFNSTQTMTVAGNGTTFEVQNGGSATLIAGQKIDFLHGTTVQPGGYLHGYIAPTGPWCNQGSSLPQVNPIIESRDSIGQDIPISRYQDGKFFKIYPNPTTSTFTLELSGIDKELLVHVEVYSMRGETIHSKQFTGERIHEFSLANKPAGIYFIRVIAGERVETGKIIKH